MKKNNIIIGVLAFIIVLLSSYIIYDKVLVDDKTDVVDKDNLDDDKNQDNNGDNKVEDKVENDNEINLSFYSEEEMKEYQNYIKKELGEFDGIIHEIVSDDIHLDIIVIPPTKENNYYKLVTMGMGAYMMNVPKELKKYQFERAELVLYLPPDWDIKSKEEKYYWPIRQLKTLARLPFQTNSWLGLGHTVSNDAKNSPYADNTKLCSMLLLFAFNNEYDTIKEFDFRKNEKINFYQLFPIYENELNYIFNTNWNEFIDLAGDSIVMPIDINRDSFVKNDNK